MRTQSPAFAGSLVPDLTDMLATLRARRGFDAASWVAGKLDLIEGYWRECGLDAAVLGLSGGIDSAVVALLLATARDAGHLDVVWPMALPVHVPGATGQDEAVLRAHEVAFAAGLPLHVIELAGAHERIAEAVETAVGKAGASWARGQLVATTRTPTLYYATSLLTEGQHAGVVVGTTNRDEGAYLGYVGKTSDMAVDVQLVSDLHKSEVRAVARLLGCPDSVLAVTPTGDMYDARTDETVFGADYDAVELLIGLYCAPDALALRARCGRVGTEQLSAIEANLGRLHAHNAHKYRSGDPAVHLCLLPRGCPGGWPDTRWTPAPERIAA